MLLRWWIVSGCVIRFPAEATDTKDSHSASLDYQRHTGGGGWGLHWRSVQLNPAPETFVFSVNKNNRDHHHRLKMMMGWNGLILSGAKAGERCSADASSYSSPHLLHNYSFATVGIYCASPVNYKLILSLAGWLFPLETQSCPPRFTEWLWRPISGREVKKEDKELTAVCRRNVIAARW